MTVNRDGTARLGGIGLDPRRLGAGLGWGALATVLMSVVMLLGTATGVAPMPKPVPVALVARTLGALPQPLSPVLAAVAHLAYGAVAAAVLAGLVRRVSVWIGLGHGVLLWALMGLVWLPYLGWGLFGVAVTPRIAVATLVLHLVYGAVLGLVLDRKASSTIPDGDVSGCARCGPRAADSTPAVYPVGAAPGTSRGGLDADSAQSGEAPGRWAPESCTLPTAQQPVRAAEFAGLFSGALRAVERPEPARLRLVLDPDWEDTVRELTAREGRCCTFFTFDFRRHDDGLHLEITVAANQQSVLDALARQAGEGAR